MPLHTVNDEPGQTYLVDPAAEPIPVPDAPLQRRQAAASMISDLLNNTPLTDLQIALRLGRNVATIERYRQAKTAPAGEAFEDLWRFWNYHMAQAKAQGRTLTHS